MKELAIGLLWLVAAIAYLIYRKPKSYRDLYPVFVTLTCCAAAFFLGTRIGGDAVKADLAMVYVNEEDFDLAAPVAGNAFPLFEAMLVCTAMIVLFVAVRFVLEIVEDVDD